MYDLSACSTVRDVANSGASGEPDGGWAVLPPTRAQSLPPADSVPSWTEFLAPLQHLNSPTETVFVDWLMS